MSDDTKPSAPAKAALSMVHIKTAALLLTELTDAVLSDPMLTNAYAELMLYGVRDNDSNKQRVHRANTYFLNVFLGAAPCGTAKETP